MVSKVSVRHLSILTPCVFQQSHALQQHSPNIHGTPRCVKDFSAGHFSEQGPNGQQIQLYLALK